MKPKFIVKKKVEKYDSSDTNIMDTPLLVIGTYEFSTPSIKNDVIVTVAIDNTPMCTISKNDQCPVGYKSSLICSTINNNNTNVCVLDSSYAPMYSPVYSPS